MVDIQKLRSHHGTPPSFGVSCSMGRTAWDKTGKWQSGGHSSSWGAWPAQEKDKTVQTPATLTDLSYKNVKVVDNAAGNKAGSKLQAWAAQNGMTVPKDILQAMEPTQDLHSKSLQKAVNHLRKVELRVRGIRTAMQTSETQWKTFQRQLQDMYAKQLQAFQSEMRSHRERLMIAEQEEQDAKSALEAAMAGVSTSLPPPASFEYEAGNVLPTWLTGAPLDAMDVEDWEPTSSLRRLPECTKQEMDSELMRPPGDFSTPVRGDATAASVLGNFQAKNTSVSAQGTAPATPLRPTLSGIPSPVRPMSAGAHSAEGLTCLTATKETQYRDCSGQATSDPYQSSPGNVPPSLHDMQAWTTPPSSKRRTPWSGIKEASRPKGPVASEGSHTKTTLADKLVQSRQRASAIASNSSRGRRPASILIDDDNGDDPASIPVPSGSELDVLE